MILGGKLPGKVGRCRFFRPHGQAVKTSPFHGGNSGSIPDGVTSQLKNGNQLVPIFQKNMESKYAEVAQG